MALCAGVGFVGAQQQCDGRTTAISLPKEKNLVGHAPHTSCANHRQTPAKDSPDAVKARRAVPGPIFSRGGTEDLSPLTWTRSIGGAPRAAICFFVSRPVVELSSTRTQSNHIAFDARLTAPPSDRVPTHRSRLVRSGGARLVDICGAQGRREAHAVRCSLPYLCNA
jgi:hypothetical protein